MNITRNPPAAEVKQLLSVAELPTEDITPNHMKNFFGAWSGAALEGVVGLELYGAVALLRSLAVTMPKRRSGLGARLLAQAEQYAVDRGVRSMFLLTTTAETYFGKRGYSSIPRDSVPEAIRNTAEFTGLCPASSVLMFKDMPGSAAPNLIRSAGRSRSG